jgi:hypothetical protein
MKSSRAPNTNPLVEICSLISFLIASGTGKNENPMREAVPMLDYEVDRQLGTSRWKTSEETAGCSLNEGNPESPHAGLEN